MEAQKWFDQRSQDLSEQERKFISASRALRERLAREERERQERELEAAQKLARTEAERADDQARAAARLRWLMVALVAVCLLAVGAALFALAKQHEAWAKRQEAAQQAQIALSRQIACAGPGGTSEESATQPIIGRRVRCQDADGRCLR
jgi:hypothetical protein